MSDASPDKITTVAVIGAGTMGHGIAQVCAMAGCTTRLTDVGDEQVQAGLARIGKNPAKGVARGKVSEEQQAATLGHLSGTAVLEDAAGLTEGAEVKDFGDAWIVAERVPNKASGFIDGLAHKSASKEERSKTVLQCNRSGQKGSFCRKRFCLDSLKHSKRFLKRRAGVITFGLRDKPFSVAPQ